jgi:hypothetical protein
MLAGVYYKHLSYPDKRDCGVSQREKIEQKKEPPTHRGQEALGLFKNDI